MAAEFYPDAYYSIVLGPVVNQWLDARVRAPGAIRASRPDWVTTTEQTDANWTSFGCAAMFIYYLRYQLGFEWSDIITKAGSTLAATYQALTKKTDAFDSFERLLNRFFPTTAEPAMGGQVATYLRSDNVFPLREDPSERVVRIDFVQKPTYGPSQISLAGDVTLRPFPTCTPGTYKFYVHQETKLLKCTATVFGFGQPQLTWKVNGNPVGSLYGGIEAKVFEDVAADPAHPKTATETISFRHSFPPANSYAGMAGELDLTNLDFPGRVVLTVSVEVADKSDPTGVTTESAQTTLDTAFIRYERAYYQDRRKCLDSFRDRMSRFVEKTNLISLLLTLPDPPGDLRQGLRMLEQIKGELAQIGRKDKKAAQAITRTLAAHLAIPSRSLSPRTATTGRR